MEWDLILDGEVVNLVLQGERRGASEEGGNIRVTVAMNIFRCSPGPRRRGETVKLAWDVSPLRSGLAWPRRMRSRALLGGM
ncbi:hypothetical protein M758_6G161800 [Ceratodon purpureus]|nr:hypothetical protein M758_6G161800 [Ceratodon purpureus]